MRAQSVGLNASEYAKIVDLMGREPNDVELGLFGALWSEHCSYKNTKNLLRRLPHEGDYVVEGPGGNAGVVRLTDTAHIAFKVESHNHPSYVEPVQGAATGVGGILRDIIAMGARPIALADALRFGLDEKSMHLRDLVVKGIGQYGNAIGIPTVTGDIGYSPTYATNPLVNVLAVGVRHPQKGIDASTARAGQLIILLGQRTGRDGIHGASLLASQDFSHDGADMRPTVQVGDPFLGKLLMESTLALVESGYLAALQDLGAAGLTSAVAELCASSGVGAHLWLDQVPLREPGLTPYEIMLSETQERMLMTITPEDLNSVSTICAQHEVAMSVIGDITDTGHLELSFQGELVADVKAEWLVDDAPRRAVDPRWWDSLNASVAVSQEETVPSFSVGLLLRVLEHPDMQDREPIYRQYDSMIQTNTIQGPGHDAAILRLRGEDRGLVVAVAGPGRWSAVDAYAGGQGAVLRSLAAVVASGATPMGMTDGVNAGNPDKDESYTQLAALIRGVADAAQAARVPVTGGNVSLHNETSGESIWPTVIIGVVGSHPEPLDVVADRLLAVGDRVIMINPGPLEWGGSVAAILSGSGDSYPRARLERVASTLEAVRQWNKAHTTSVSVVGEGGMAGTLVRMMARSDYRLGLDITLKESRSEEKTLRFYNEAPLQWLATIKESELKELQSYFSQKEVPVYELGIVTDTGLLRVDEKYQWTRSDLLSRWRGRHAEVSQ